MMLRLAVRGAGWHARSRACAATAAAARTTTKSASTSSGAAALAAVAAKPANHHHHKRPSFTSPTAAPFSSSSAGGFPMDDVLGAPVSRGTADPDFAIFGDDCLLKFRLSTYVAPGAAGMYKSNNARLLLEFTRKNAGGVYDWRATKRLSMTPEEIGLLLDSGPTEELIFKRSGMASPPAGQQGSPPKEVKFIPTATGDWIIHLSVDGEAYEVTVTRGRKAIVKSLIHASLPAIFGWHKVTGGAGGSHAGGYHAQQHHYGGGGMEHHGGGGGVPF